MKLIVGFIFGWFLRGVDWSSLPTHWAPEPERKPVNWGEPVQYVPQALARRQRGDG